MNRNFWVLGLVCIGLAGGLSGISGCVGLPQSRLQSQEESEQERDLDVRTIGEVTEIANAQPIQVSGVGLVTGLQGTGGSPNGTFRTMLEQQLRKQKVEHVKALLDSSDNALVMVTAFIPAGGRKGDVLDIEVTLPQGSKATSLRGGYLEDCFLRNYEQTKALNPQFAGGNKLLQGHVLARAKGPLLVGFGNTDEPAELRRARIWGGGMSNIDRPFYLILTNDEKSVRIADAVAGKINLMFQDDLRKQQIVLQNQRLFLLDDVTHQINDKYETPMGRGEMAKALNKEMVNVRVPYAYRFNPERYLRVVRLIPLREVADQQGRYRRRLHKMLLDPTDTVRAALRLEALGKESIPALRKGLENESPLVRFASAEALTYLGSAAGVEELATLATQHQELRLLSLMALAGLEESICRQKLTEMLASGDSELRCGAFRALRLMDQMSLTENHMKLCRARGEEPPLGADLLNQAFWLHKVAPGGPKLAHFALGKRAEIVLFGDDITLTPIKTLAGADFTVTAEPGDDRCTISRITTQGGIVRKQCSLRLEDVLRTMADMGAQYPEAVDLLRKLDDRRALNCPVAINTMPPEMSIERLAEGGRDPNFLRASPVSKSGETQ